MRGCSSSVVTAFVIAGGVMAGCVQPDEDVKDTQDTAELGVKPLDSAFVLTVSTLAVPQDEVDVASSAGGVVPVFGSGVQIAEIAGATLTLTVPNPIDTVNCVHFAGWTGTSACTGQGNPCTFVITGDCTARVTWAHTSGCMPQ